MSTGILSELSNQLASAVEKASPSIVRVDDGTRLTASGVVWRSDGVIVATSHGVERDEELFVELGDGSRLSATVIGRDPESDIAVLRVEATNLTAVELAQAQDVRVGSLTVAVARPGRTGLTATFGIVSSKYEAVQSGKSEHILGTDATLYPGFSGGALIDTEGRFTGLLNLMFGRRSAVALGASMVSSVVETLIAHGCIKRGYLGIGTQIVAIPANLQTAASGQQRGLLVVHVQPSSPAEQSGLTIGDVLLSLDETKVNDVDDLRSRLRNKVAGESVALQVLRGGTLTKIDAVLGEEN